MNIHDILITYGWILLATSGLLGFLFVIGSIVYERGHERLADTIADLMIILLILFLIELVPILLTIAILVVGLGILVFPLFFLGHLTAKTINYAKTKIT